MCGRTRTTLQRAQLAALAGVPPEAFVNGDKYRPVENMGPGRYGAVVFRAPHRPKQENEEKPRNQLQAMRWGLIPSFTKPHLKPDHFIMFNARSESLHDRPAFRRLLETKRCVVICDGYYEWQQVDKREKQPYYVYRETGPLKFAGLYDSWVNNDGERMYSYTILTTDIKPEMSWMHTRMPVILTEEGAERWLSDAKFDSLRDLTVSYRGDDLKWHPVDKKVGSTKFQSEDCSKKVDIKHAANIKSFFGDAVVKKEPEIADFDLLDDDFLATPLMKRDISEEIKETKPVVPPPHSAPPPTTKQPPFSPIKAFFQAQAAASVASPSKPTPTFVAASSLMGTKRSSPSPKRPQQSPKRPQQSPKRARKTQPPTSKNPARGTLLDYFQRKT
ncbi:hypothetical protein Poli38472_008601 [Pythium oligandrum]|uniref:Embryonic stem cell-specific 5-hydroxymethylcytosine-binding protein n=1 Tax=Pythium oligandrum TaxID=41045 RepID=A0A8K1C3V5_PYTOL|nr:hypothetical protein Poli38472_008601 [Pythium oligandrum]|eukprot:TMW55953.1 hypothetical protein Poli38472_008601 [Pythium oligandrum]